MLVHPFRVMDVSISMATGAPDFIPGTSANVREVAGYSGFYAAPTNTILQQSADNSGAHITQGVWQQHTPCNSAGSATPVFPLTCARYRIVEPYV